MSVSGTSVHDFKQLEMKNECVAIWVTVVQLCSAASHGFWEQLGF